MWKRPALALLAFAVLGLGLTACGDSSASQDEIEAARKQGASKAREQQKIHKIEKELQNLKKAKAGTGAGTGAAVPPSEGSGSSGNCGGSLSVNEHTSCSFAENVEDAYYAEVGSGAGVVYAYSPTTGQTYSMYCTAGSPHECTGGNDAAAYFP
jgi:pantoate kinase